MLTLLIDGPMIGIYGCFVGLIQTPLVATDVSCFAITKLADRTESSVTDS